MNFAATKTTATCIHPRAITSVTIAVTFMPTTARVIVDGRLVYEGRDVDAAGRICSAWRALSLTNARVRWKIPPDRSGA